MSSESYDVLTIDVSSTNNKEVVLNDKEIALEEIYNKWDTLTDSEKFNTFILFSKVFSAASLPISIIFIVYMSTFFTNIMFVSHSSKPNRNDLLAGVGLGTTLYNMIGTVLAIGLASGLDTLCTQAYGAKMFYLMGCYLNRTRVILSLLYIPIFFLLFFLENLLLLINQPSEIAYYSSQYCRGTLVGLWFFYQIEAMRRFMQAQGIYILPVLLLILTTALHPLWVFIFYEICDLGPFGIGLSVSIGNILNFIFITIVVKYKAKKGSFFMINIDSFKGWKEFLEISIPSCLMTCLETWNYQITTLMAGYLEKIQFDANLILINISLFFYMYPFGLNVAASNLVGKYVGRFSIKATELTSKFIILYSFILSTLVMILILILRPFLPYIYTNDEELCEIVKTLILFYIYYEFFDFLTTSFGGIFRGLGLQKWIATAMFICFYLISIPLGYTFTYTFGFEIYGIRMTYIIAITVLVLFYSLIYWKKVDYYGICIESRRRLSRDSNLIKGKNTQKEELLKS